MNECEWLPQYVNEPLYVVTFPFCPNLYCVELTVVLFAEFTESENCGFGPVTTVPPLFSEPVCEVCIEMDVSGGEKAEATNKGEVLTKTISTAKNTLFLAVNGSPQS